MSHRPENIHLDNWRESPYNHWALHHVRELIPTANIRSNSSNISALSRTGSPLSDMTFEGVAGQPQPLEAVLSETWTDALCVMQGDSIVHEWYAPHYDGVEPHILFSVSKSVTGALAGVLVEGGRLAVDEAVTTYIPEAAGSGFGDCSVQQVLDMQAGLDFTEIYTGGNAQFHRYRAATGWNYPAPGELPGDLRSFLVSIGHSGTPHGHTHLYMSPNSDMLGLILESASGERFSDLVSRHFWQPMGAEADAYVTVDPKGAPRAAGGICVRPRDLARFGRTMCNGGRFNGKQIVPERWVEDCLTAGSREAWQRGDMIELVPHGKYRNQWYQTGNASGTFFALGIHGQWIYGDPAAEVVIIKFSSQPDPFNDALNVLNLRLFSSITQALM
ncbi:serine hydrolase domain-containing protein [Pseudomonadota bacterium]